MRLLFSLLSLLMTSFVMPNVSVAQDQTVSDVQNSGCTARARGAEAEEPAQTIVLTKEGNILSVQLLNYEANCCAEDFDITSHVEEGNNGAPCTLSINAIDVGAECDCICPFNLSFTIRDLEPNTFYLKCWWYDGLVELTEGISYQAVNGGTFQPLNHTLLSDDKEWTMAYLGAMPPEYEHLFSLRQIKLGSTIEFNGMSYRQLVDSWRESDQESYGDWTELNKYIGEADGKVYLYDAELQDAVTVMDFTLKVGDTYRQQYSNDLNDGYMDYVVVAVKDTVFASSIDKIPHKCIYLSRRGSSDVDDIWVEDIGSLVGGVFGAYIYFWDGLKSLRVCNKNGQSLYEAYHPFLKEGKTWNYENRYYDYQTKEGWTKAVSYVINGKTEIDGKTYYKMYRVCEDENRYCCAIREDNRKVWKHTEEGDLLLYDFGLADNASYMLQSIYQIWLSPSSKKPMQFHFGELLNVLYYDGEIYYPDFQPDPLSLFVVEGVGYRNGWDISQIFPLVPTNGDNSGENFLSCYEDGRCIFTVEDFEKVETGIKSPQITGTKAEGPSAYYSLSGQRLPAPQRGINIVRMPNGKTKKVVIK